jgi:hypothetical protein
MQTVRSLRLDKIIEDLNNNVTLSAAIPWGIYFWQKGRDDNKDADLFPVYVNSYIVSDVKRRRNSDQKTARVSFTFIGNRTAVPADVLDIVDLLTNEIVKNWCQKRHVFTETGLDVDGVFIDAIEESNMFWPNFDELNRVVIVKDFLFTYRHIDG